MDAITREAACFCMAALSGATLYLAYLILCLFRELVRHSHTGVDAEDLAYWVLAGFYLFYQIYAATRGIIRWYFAAGAILGAAFAKFVIFCGKSAYTKIQKSLEKRAEKR